MTLHPNPLPTMEVRLLGRLCIESGGQSIHSRFSSQKLLIFGMIVTQQYDALNREQLAFTLWPDITETEAKANLRRKIYELQRCLPGSTAPWIYSDSRTVGWAAGDRTFVDVSEFTRRCKSETPSSALDYYRGDFLADVDHEWAVTYRDRLREEATRLLADAVRDAWAAGEMMRCLSFAERLLALDPWREDVLRYVLSARCRGGDRAGAVAVYRRFRERLYRELEITPMRETEDCIDMLRRGETPNVSQPILCYSQQ